MCTKTSINRYGIIWYYFFNMEKFVRWGCPYDDKHPPPTQHYLKVFLYYYVQCHLKIYRIIRFIYSKEITYLASPPPAFCGRTIRSHGRFHPFTVEIKTKNESKLCYNINQLKFSTPFGLPILQPSLCNMQTKQTLW